MATRPAPPLFAETSIPPGLLNRTHKCRRVGASTWLRSSAECASHCSSSRTAWRGRLRLFGRSAALDVGQQDRRVTGPVDIVGDQVIDPVGNDAGVDAEQQLVGDHRAKIWEQVAAGLENTTTLAHHVLRAAQMLTECDDPDGAGACRQ